VADGRVTVTVDYDAVGNRTHVHTHVDDLVTQDSDRYYQYDAMNRQIVVDALDGQGTLGSQGHRLTYDANGNRKSDASAAGVETYVVCSDSYPCHGRRPECPSGHTTRVRLTTAMMASVAPDTHNHRSWSAIS
jgi:YD repeat-containing protein